MQLRGADLRGIREKALERLNKFGISTTLVVTVERGVNDGELGAIVDFALHATGGERSDIPARAAGGARAGIRFDAAPPDADRGAAADSRTDRRLPAGGSDSGSLPS